MQVNFAGAARNKEGNIYGITSQNEKNICGYNTKSFFTIMDAFF